VRYRDHLLTCPRCDATLVRTNRGEQTLDEMCISLFAVITATVQ